MDGAEAYSCRKFEKEAGDLGEMWGEGQIQGPKEGGGWVRDEYWIDIKNLYIETKYGCEKTKLKIYGGINRGMERGETKEKSVKNEEIEKA